MKILKNKKSWASIATILIALSMIVGSTFAWFIIRGNASAGNVEVGSINYDMDLGVDLTDLPPLEAGMYFAPAELIDSYTQTWISDWSNLDANQKAALGYIKNTGNLPIMVKIGDGLNVTRYWKDGPDHEPGMGRLDQMIPDPGYPGVPGAILGQLIFPPTQKNINALSVNFGAMIYSDDNGDYYLVLDVGAEVDAAFVLDLKKNAAWSGNNDELYLDNTYMNCKIDLGKGWLATQFNPHDAWLSAFGPTVALDFDFVNNWMLAGMGIPGYNYGVIELPVK